MIQETLFLEDLTLKSVSKTIVRIEQLEKIKKLSFLKLLVLPSCNFNIEVPHYLRLHYTTLTEVFGLKNLRVIAGFLKYQDNKKNRHLNGIF